MTEPQAPPSDDEDQTQNMLMRKEHGGSEQKKAKLFVAPTIFFRIVGGSARHYLPS